MIDLCDIVAEAIFRNINGSAISKSLPKLVLKGIALGIKGLLRSASLFGVLSLLLTFFLCLENSLLSDDS